jgi:RecB family exonuclease
MRESYSATAYWRRRSESREEWAARAETFFRLLAECHPSFSRWYEEGRSAEESLQLGFEPRGRPSRVSSGGARATLQKAASSSEPGPGTWRGRTE